jgi:hypothetical protein
MLAVPLPALEADRRVDAVRRPLVAHRGDELTVLLRDRLEHVGTPGPGRRPERREHVVDRVHPPVRLQQALGRRGHRREDQLAPLQLGLPPRALDRRSKSSGSSAERLHLVDRPETLGVAVVEPDQAPKPAVGEHGDR